jgi:tetratricopeptide (TPR) repeat protein
MPFAGHPNVGTAFVLGRQGECHGRPIEGGALVLRGRGVLYSRVRVPGNLKLTFDALADSGDEILVRIKCDSTYGINSLYYRFYWAGNICKWRKEGLWSKGGFKDDYFAQENVAADLDLSLNRWHHMEVTYEDGLCRAFIDGALVNEVRDAFPLNGLDNSRWGFWSLVGKLGIDNVKVYRQVLPQRVDITRMVDVYIEQKEYDRALEQLIEMIGNYQDRELLILMVKKILAIGQFVPEFDLYSGLLARPGLADKVLSVQDSALADQFMERAVNVIAEKGGEADLRNLDSLIGKFGASLRENERFDYYVYLGIALRKARDASYSRKYFAQALSLRNDTTVAEYAKNGVIPGPRIFRGRQTLVRGGYLPFRFGKCLPVRSFYMDSVEVTRGNYLAVMGKIPADTNPGLYMARPVSNVTFYDAILFCNERSKKEGLDTCYITFNFRDTVFNRKKENRKIVETKAEKYSYVWLEFKERVFDVRWIPSACGYRLPLMNEFEYAYRAGSTTQFFWGDDGSLAGEYAWYRVNSGDSLHAAATRKPNDLGLYDVAGNVREWCWDATGEGRRFAYGGSRQSSPREMHAGYRISLVPSDRDNNLGFRCARNAP